MTLAYNDPSVSCDMCGRHNSNDYILNFESGQSECDEISVCKPCIDKSVDTERLKLTNKKYLEKEREEDDCA